MNVDAAAKMTMNIAKLQKSNWSDYTFKDMSYEHLESMWERWSDDMSYGKKCRWLGWMQATVVAMTYPYTSLETMKEINKNCAKDVK